VDHDQIRRITYQDRRTGRRIHTGSFVVAARKAANKPACPQYLWHDMPGEEAHPNRIMLSHRTIERQCWALFSA